MPKLHFIQAAPLKTGKTTRKSLPKKPGGAKAEWERSVYYYWWAFLRENEDYLLTCEGNGIGPCAKLYEDFGDLRDGDFWKWWRGHNHLFAEPTERKITVVEDVAGFEPQPKTLVLEIPLEGKLSHRITQIRRELSKHMSDTRHRKPKSEAKYKIHSKPVISALHSYLRTWQLRKAHPTLPFADIYAILNGEEVDIEEASKPKTKMTKSKYRTNNAGWPKHTHAAYRKHKFAKEIIANVGKGIFPLFNQKRVRKRVLNRSV
jgi:hypothetical protein